MTIRNIKPSVCGRELMELSRPFFDEEEIAWIWGGSHLR